MNKFQTLTASRWSYSPMKGLRDAMDKLNLAMVIGQQCDECHRVLIEQIVVCNGKKYHEACYYDS